MGKYLWTAKRKSALEHLIRSKKNARIAAESSQLSDVPVSLDYINDLKSRPEHKPFRDEYRRRTRELLDAMEVDTRYVITGLVELTKESGIPPGVRRQAYRDLGDYLGIWAPEKHEYREVEDWEYEHEWGHAAPKAENQSS